VGAHLPQLTSLSVVATHGVCDLDGQSELSSSLLDGLPALSSLTRLTALVVTAGNGEQEMFAGGCFERGALARDVLPTLPHGAPLKQVGWCIISQHPMPDWAGDAPDARLGRPWSCVWGCGAVLSHSFGRVGQTGVV
jgi:hypothetical protein